MTRVIRVRPGQTPGNVWVGWRYGEGVVGWSWADNSTRSIDYGDLALSTVADEAAFHALPSDKKLEMKYEDFVISVRGFRAVWASPIQARDHAPVGVLSLNIDRVTGIPWPALKSLGERAVETMARRSEYMLGLRP